MQSVVVGVDGSKHSLTALRQAVTEARCRDAELHVVYAYEPPRSTNIGAAGSALAYGSWASANEGAAMLRDARERDEAERSETRRRAEDWLRQFVREQDLDLDGVSVQVSAVGEEHPAAALVRVSQNATMLVVGSRGFGGFGGLLLGSVSQHCVRHASCPVLVTRSG